MLFEAALVAAAERRVAAARRDVEKARASELEEIEWARANKETLVAGYWQARHDAELRLRVAERVLEAALAAQKANPS